jgi:LPS-assembly lipoprotein
MKMMTLSALPTGRMRAFLLMLAAALLLSACGFKLRGSSGNYTLPFLKMYVALPTSSPLAVELKRNIRVNGSTEVVNDSKDADGILELLGDPDKTRGKSILALNSNGRVRQYLLTYNITFRVRDNKGNELLQPTSLSLNRPMDFDETQLLAKESEEAGLYRDMQLDLVQQMMRRMAAIKTAPMINTAPSSQPMAPAQPVSSDPVPRAAPAAPVSVPVNPPSNHE